MRKLTLQLSSSCLCAAGQPEQESYRSKKLKYPNVHEKLLRVFCEKNMLQKCLKLYKVIKVVSKREKSIEKNYCETGAFSWIFETLLIILRLALFARYILVSKVQLLIVITVLYQLTKRLQKGDCDIMNIMTKTMFSDNIAIKTSK